MKKILILLTFTCCCAQSVNAQLVLEFLISADPDPIYFEDPTYVPRTISLPLNGTVNVTVDWGDGTSENITTSGLASHTYITAGNKTVTITGMLTWFGDNNANLSCLTRVQSWDNLGLTSFRYGFKSARRLISVPTSLPIGITDLAHMFEGASSFNQPIDTWNTANVTDMSGMFWDAISFNQPLGTWNTEAVISMSEMFTGATSFNQPIGAWNTANVTNMSRMFYVATSFNQPLSTWNTEAVTNMSEMFYYAISFNQPLGLWNTENVTNMYAMFNLARSFDQPLDAWDTGNVTDMSSMFSAAFSFNQPIQTWNVEAVINMQNMFTRATAFNQPLDAWNTGNVANMLGMFSGAFSFNQPLGTWNVEALTDLTYMFTDDTLCTDNYDNLLNSWSTQMVKHGLTFHGGYSQYSSASSTARTNLINNYGWTIIDGGLNSDNTKCSNYITAGLQANVVFSAVGVYPNPSTGQVTVSSNEALGTIIIFNPVGTIVYQTNTSALQQNIDLSKNEPGLYLVKIGNQTYKLAKE